MTQSSPYYKAVLDRLKIVTAYLSTDMAVTSFAELYNAGGICRPLLEEAGPVEAEDLDEWADLCLGLAGREPPEEDLEDEAGEDGLLEAAE